MNKLEFDYLHQLNEKLEKDIITTSKALGLRTLSKEDHDQYLERYSMEPIENHFFKIYDDCTHYQVSYSVIKNGEAIHIFTVNVSMEDVIKYTGKS